MTDTPDLTGPVPLFPLPNVVLFPRAVLPLHIFEERYKQMTADVLDGDRQVAMALLRPGWEKDYYSRPAIHPIVCVGKIISHEKLPDGKYNFLLQGRTRARIVRELHGEPYRIAELAELEQVPAMEIDLEAERRELEALFARRPLAALPSADYFRHLFRGVLPTVDLADLIAFALLEDADLKQSLLGEADARTRVRRLVDAMRQLHMPAGLASACGDPALN